LKVEREVEGLGEFCVKNAIVVDTAVFAVPDYLLALGHEFHVEFNQVFVLA
jgi:hypothetical protein